jgi:hypothetical protein
MCSFSLTYTHHTIYQFQQSERERKKRVYSCFFISSRDLFLLQFSISVYFVYFCTFHLQNFFFLFIYNGIHIRKVLLLYTTSIRSFCYCSLVFRKQRKLRYANNWNWYVLCTKVAYFLDAVTGFLGINGNCLK